MVFLMVSAFAIVAFFVTGPTAAEKLIELKQCKTHEECVNQTTVINQKFTQDIQETGNADTNKKFGPNESDEALGYLKKQIGDNLYMIQQRGEYYESEIKALKGHIARLNNQELNQQAAQYLDGVRGVVEEMKRFGLQ